MGYEQSVLQRRLCTNSPSAHLQWRVQGDANDPLVVQCPSHHLYYLSSKKILIFKVVCRHRSCIHNGSAVWCRSPGAVRVYLHAHLHRCLRTTAGAFGSAPVSKRCGPTAPELMSSTPLPCSGLILFRQTTFLHPWSGSTRSAPWVCGRGGGWQGFSTKTCTVF